MRLFKNRIETTKGLDKGKWTLWRWYDIVINGKLYLSRLTLFGCPWFSVKLHWIHLPDPDRDLHDHPWPFVSFILRGWYKELECLEPDLRRRLVEDGFPANSTMLPRVRERLVRWFNSKDTCGAHRITEVSPNVLTLVITGPRTKSWGFYNEETFKFTDWEIYTATEQQGTKMS